jgi:1A family penicillin-binding protein
MAHLDQIRDQVNRMLRDQTKRVREQMNRALVRWNRLRDSHPRELKAAARVSAAVVIVFVVATGWFLLSLIRSLPDRESLTAMAEMDQATAVFDASDSLAFTIFKEQRIEVPLDAMGPHVAKALIAIEDRRFYDHHGFDVIRIVSAALKNLRHLRVVEGASTITQQLARTSFLTLDKTYSRKLQELFLAARIERTFSKDRILELYLNKVYFGDGLYGVEAASRGYFAKHASDLTLAEAATLAGLMKSPSTYAPTVSRTRATARRNLVLAAMVDAGFIDRQTRDAARSVPLVVRDGLNADEPYGLYFKEQVRRELVERFGWQRVYQGGLRVFSTIDMEMQKAAETAVADGLKAIDARRKAPEPEPLQAALVAMDPATGHVRAMVGGRDFTKSSFNRAVQARRQPGSAFKPFVYAAALEAGFTPATMIEDLDVPVETLQGAWTPEDEHSTATAMSLRAALRTSSNRAAVRLLQEVGIPKTVDYARTMGVGDVPSVPSLALGSGEVTLQSMTAAYAAFANQGQVPKPMTIRRVEDRDGRVLFATEESSTSAISPTTAFLMTTMLADVINAGTGARARSVGFKLPAAGKTGTTNDFKDAWFIGFTPSLISGVWVGFDQPHTIMRNGFAGDIAVPMWASFMKTATEGDKPQYFKAPSGVSTASVCRLSGKLANDGCQDVEVVDERGGLTKRSMVYTEYFAKDTVPDQVCDLHSRRNFFGSVASIFTGGGEGSAPARAEDAGLPPAPGPAAASTSGQASVVEPASAVPEAPKKKRGFWSRLFGIGRDDDKDDDKDKDSKQKDDKKR